MFTSPANTDLRVADYDAVSEEGVPAERVAGAALISSDLGRLTEQIHGLASLGFDAVYLHHIGQEQRGFIEAFGEKVLPQLR